MASSCLRCLYPPSATTRYPFAASALNWIAGEGEGGQVELNCVEDVNVEVTCTLNKACVYKTVRCWRHCYLPLSSVAPTSSHSLQGTARL